MREIKFRAWDKNLLEMFYNRDNVTVFSWPAEHHEINQYTGLKDKNGREIYEGDIVSITACPVVIKMGDDSAGEIEPGLVEPPCIYVEKATPPRLLTAEVRISPVNGMQLLVRKAKWAEDPEILRLFTEPFSSAKYSDNWSLEEMDADERIDNYVGKRLSFRKKDIIEVIGNIYENPELLEVKS